MDHNPLKSNTTMTEVERLELAKKLDADLDEFINNLPRRKYEDGWPEDSWEEVYYFILNISLILSIYIHVHF